MKLIPATGHALLILAYFEDPPHWKRVSQAIANMDSQRSQALSMRTGSLEGFDSNAK